MMIRIICPYCGYKMPIFADKVRGVPRCMGKVQRP